MRGLRRGALDGKVKRNEILQLVVLEVVWGLGIRAWVGVLLCKSFEERAY